MGDTFRRNYRALSAEEKLALDAVKVAAEHYESALARYVQPGRALALATTKLEESIMWATKAISG